MTQVKLLVGSLIVGTSFVVTASAAVVFSDSFAYDGDLVAGGGWTTNSGLSAVATDGKAWAQTGWAEYNYGTALNVGDEILMDAAVVKYAGAPGVGGNTYAYSLQVILWDGANDGSKTWVAGDAHIANSADLNQTSYTATAGDAGKYVIFRLEHEDQSLPGSVGGGWGESDNVSFSVNPVPEPSLATLLSIGGLALIMRRRK